MKTICPHCHQDYDVEPADLGRLATCEGCQQDFTVEPARMASRMPLSMLKKWIVAASVAGCLAGGLVWLSLHEAKPAPPSQAPVSAVHQDEPVPAAVPWHQGGTLRDATLAEWNAATHPNKLATAADWLKETVWKGHETPDDLAKMKGNAETMVSMVDHFATMENPDPAYLQSLARKAATLSMLVQRLGPEPPPPVEAGADAGAK